MKYILGISGPIGSGKSTVAEILTQLSPRHAHLETSTVVCELADTFNLALEELIIAEPELHSVGFFNKIIERMLSQLTLFAGRPIQLEEVAISQAEIDTAPEWYEKLYVYVDQAFKKPQLLAQPVSPSNKTEYRALLQWIGGYFLRKIDPLLWYKELFRRMKTLDHTIILVALTAPRQPAEAEYIRSLGGIVISIERPNLVVDNTDVTERQRNAIRPDVVIVNNGNIVELKRACKALLHDLHQKQLQPTYLAVKNS